MFLFDIDIEGWIVAFKFRTFVTVNETEKNETTVNEPKWDFNSKHLKLRLQLKSQLGTMLFSKTTAVGILMWGFNLEF